MVNGFGFHFLQFFCILCNLFVVCVRVCVFFCFSAHFFLLSMFFSLCLDMICHEFKLCFYIHAYHIFKTFFSILFLVTDQIRILNANMLLHMHIWPLNGKPRPPSLSFHISFFVAPINLSIYLSHCLAPRSPPFALSYILYVFIFIFVVALLS